MGGPLAEQLGTGVHQDWGSDHRPHDMSTPRAGQWGTSVHQDWGRDHRTHDMGAPYAEKWGASLQQVPEQGEHTGYGYAPPL